MSLLAGVVFLSTALLALRALMFWYARRGPVGGFADAMVVNFVLPLISAAFVTGAGMSVASIWVGASLADAGMAAVAATACVLAWRRLGRLRGGGNVVAFVPQPGVTKAGHADSRQQAA